MVAWDGTVPQQVWQAGQVIPPVAFPPLTGVNGNLVYASSAVPEGVIVDFTSRTIYGIPETGGDGTITITVADDDNSADIEVVYETAERRVPIVVPPIPDLTFHLGDTVDYRFPVPVGGSGNYTTRLEYRPVPPWNDLPVRVTTLPDGLAYDAATRRLTGTVADNLANQGQSLAQVTLTNAQISAADPTITGWLTTGTRSGGSASVLGPSFNYPPLTGQVYHFVSLGTTAGAFFLRYDPALDEQATALPNNPSVFILRAADQVVLASFPIASSFRPVVTSRSMFWATDFLFEEGQDYYIEVATSERSGFNYVVTDTDTGQIVRVPFTMLLVSPVGGAPSAPTAVSSSVGATTAEVTLAATNVPGGRIVAGPMPAGFPVILTNLRNYDYTDRETNELFFTGLDPATGYDIYVYYEDDQGRRSAPLVVETRTEPARPSIPPVPVRGLAATPGPNRIRLTWDDLPPFQRITKLEHRINNGIWSDIPNTGVASTSYVVPGLIDGQPVTIDVRVVNPDGTSPPVSVTATPGASSATDDEAGFRLSIQSRILIDFDGLFLPLENRVLSASGENGRQPGTFDLAPGWAEIVLIASDGFIRLTAPAEHQGFYTAEDLRNRRCLVQELYESPTGRLVPVTRFGGWIEAAPLSSEGEEQIVTLSVVDRLGQYARRLVRFTSPLPREFADERARRLLSQAGIPEGEVEVPPNRVICASRTASFDSPYEGTLLALLTEVANSTGGRLIVIENQSDDGLPDVGKLRLEPVTPTRPPSVTLSDNPGTDAATYYPVAEIGNQPPAVLDPTNVYNQVEFVVPGGEQVIASDPDSIVTWGGRLFPIADVIVERNEAEALARRMLRVYSNPRLLADRVSCYLHFQYPTVGLAVARLTLADTVRLSYLPSGTADRVVAVQQVDRIRWQHLPGDKQYCQVVLEIGMLSPEATSFWIASHPGNNRLGEETYLAPASTDNLVSGGYDFVYDPDDLADAYVTTDRYGLLTFQSWPVYASERERNEYEISPADGQACIVTGDNGEGTSPRFYFHFDVYSSFDNQWLTRGRLSDADANPPVDTLTWDTDRYDDGKTWAA